VPRLSEFLPGARCRWCARNFPLDVAATSDRNVPFVLDGEASTHRTVAGSVAVNQRTRLSCHVHFFRPNGSAVPFNCRGQNISSGDLFW
jgi:hypothetical protein